MQSRDVCSRQGKPQSTWPHKRVAGKRVSSDVVYYDEAVMCGGLVDRNRRGPNVY